MKLFALLLALFGLASSLKIAPMQGRRAALAGFAALAATPAAHALRPGCDDATLCSGPSPKPFWAKDFAGPKTKDQKGFGAAAGCNIEKPCKKEVGGFPWGASLGAKALQEGGG